MNKVTKTTTIIVSSLFLAVCISIPSVSAQQTVINNDADSYTADQEPLAQAQLDQILAPIALYPDSLLSQILVAATYPLEVVQAARWRQANADLTEKQVLAAVEDKPWDPSVKALTPSTELITRLSDDLDWLQQLGDAFLQNEYQVLASVQELRQKARDNGSIADNDYYDVVTENDNIIIESTNREIVYVPYYDSRVVYGHWGWRDYQPVYWQRPSHYRLHAGFYWSDRFYLRPSVFFGGFHWGLRNLVVNPHYYDRPYSRNNRYRNIGVSKYRRWAHNPRHRRGVRYSGKSSLRSNQLRSRSNAIRHTRHGNYDRRRTSNRNVSNSVRNRTNIHRNDRRRVQIQQRSNNRVQRSGIRSSDRANVVKRGTNKRNLNIHRSNSRQQAANQARRNTVKANRNSNKADRRSASGAKKPSQTTNITRNNNSSNKSSNKKSYRSNKPNNRSAHRNSRSRHNTSNRKPHRQRN